MKHPDWLNTAFHAYNRYTTSGKSLCEYIDDSLRNFTCAYRQRSAYDEAFQKCAKMASESSRQETPLLLRKTVSRHDHSWSDNEAAIEDAFRDSQMKGYAASFKKTFMTLQFLPYGKRF